MMSLIRVTLIIVLVCYAGQSFSQDFNELTPGYYVVVAAYAKSRENVAKNYIEVLKLKGHKPLYGYNSSRNLYFVYLKYFDNL
ncbi:MAG: hypothetical protein C0490_02085, partial [Marivirga sp.]|nr:hypothetical protein [Marivirga sp.]